MDQSCLDCVLKLSSFDKSHSNANQHWKRSSWYQTQNELAHSSYLFILEFAQVQSCYNLLNKAWYAKEIQSAPLDLDSSPKSESFWIDLLVNFYHQIFAIFSGSKDIYEYLLLVLLLYTS